MSKMSKAKAVASFVGRKTYGLAKRLVEGLYNTTKQLYGSPISVEGKGLFGRKGNEVRIDFSKARGPKDYFEIYERICRLAAKGKPVYIETKELAEPDDFVHGLMMYVDSMKKLIGQDENFGKKSVSRGLRHLIPAFLGSIVVDYLLAYGSELGRKIPQDKLPYVLIGIPITVSLISFVYGYLKQRKDDEVMRAIASGDVLKNIYVVTPQGSVNVVDYIEEDIKEAEETKRILEEGKE